MSLKDSLVGRLERLADEMVPPMVSTWKEVQRRLDELNCSLANRSVPEKRRSTVSELTLREKALKAGQGRGASQAAAPRRKRGAKPQE